MNYKQLLIPALLIAAGVIVITGSLAIAQPAKDAKPAAPADATQPAMPLPPGWTQEDMMACMMAGTPGKMHERLAADAGTWQGQHTMWMFPGAEPMTSDCQSKVTVAMDGRFIRAEFSGEIPGMGPYTGLGIQGFDNVSGKFVAIWLDNHSTGIMNATGDLSEDGKTITWNYSYSCPITKKASVMREVETNAGANAKTLTMFGPDPKTGKEFKMMEIVLTRNTPAE